MSAHKLICRGRLDSIRVQSWHLNIEFLVWSGLVQFTLCSRRCLKRRSSVRRRPKQSYWEKVGRFGKMS